MSDRQIVKTTRSNIETTLSEDLINTICNMRSSGSSIQEIKRYLYAETEINFSEFKLSNFFKNNQISKGDLLIREQITVSEKLRRLEKYRRSDYVANVIEKTISSIEDDTEDLTSKEKIDAIVNLTKIMLESISKEAYANAAHGESSSKNSANVQINLNDTMKKIEQKKSDLKKQILSSKSYDPSSEAIEINVEEVEND